MRRGRLSPTRGERMKRLVVTFALACSGLALAAPAHGAVGVGVVDNRALGVPDGGAAFFALMNDVGLRELRMDMKWDPAAPTTIENQGQFESVLPVATLRGVRVVFSVQLANANAITGSPDAPAQYNAYLQLLARTFPTVKDVIVANEPNKSRFWKPTFDASGRPAAPGAYEGLLARGYDALKEVDPTINVIGVGLSPRGSDNPRAAGNLGISPVKFLQGMGVAYRASGRTKPGMDEFAFHPYPHRDT